MGNGAALRRQCSRPSSTLQTIPETGPGEALRSSSVRHPVFRPQPDGSYAVQWMVGLRYRTIAVALFLDICLQAQVIDEVVKGQFLSRTILVRDEQFVPDRLVPIVQQFKNEVS